MIWPFKPYNSLCPGLNSAIVIQLALFVEYILFSANKGQRGSITSTESQDILQENVTLPVKQGKGQGMIPQPYYNKYFFQTLNDLLFKFAK